MLDQLKKSKNVVVLSLEQQRTVNGGIFCGMKDKQGNWNKMPVETSVAGAQQIFNNNTDLFIGWCCSSCPWNSGLESGPEMTGSGGQ